MSVINKTQDTMAKALGLYTTRISKIIVTNVMNGSFVLVVRGLSLQEDFYCLMDEYTFLEILKEHASYSKVPIEDVAMFFGIPVVEDREELALQLLRNHLEEKHGQNSSSNIFVR